VGGGESRLVGLGLGLHGLKAAFSGSRDVAAGSARKPPKNDFEPTSSHVKMTSYFLRTGLVRLTATNRRKMESLWRREWVDRAIEVLQVAKNFGGK